MKFWDIHTKAEKEYFEKLVKEYNASQDKVKIEYNTFNNLETVLPHLQTMKDLIFSWHAPYKTQMASSDVGNLGTRKAAMQVVGTWAIA